LRGFFQTQSRRLLYCYKEGLKNENDDYLTSQKRITGVLVDDRHKERRQRTLPTSNSTSAHTPSSLYIALLHTS
jgi:hypothetical protein